MAQGSHKSKITMTLQHELTRDKGDKAGRGERLSRYVGKVDVNIAVDVKR